MDTGSNYTAVPRAMLDRLKVPGNESVPSRLADGSTVMVDVGVVSLEEARMAVDSLARSLIPTEMLRY